MSAAITTENLVRQFGEVRAVDGVSLEVRDGEIYGFLGPNGAGKTTLVRMLCTLLKPTGGSASVAGVDVVAAPEQVRLRIGVALQEASLDDRQTGSEFLRLQARLYGLTRTETARRMRDVTALIDLGDALDRRIATYSGGMKRRLDLAASLIHNPAVLFLDEPTTGLDPANRLAVWNEVRRLNTELGTTIFLTTQYLQEADELADRVGIIDRGRIVAEGAPDTLKRTIGADLVVLEVQPGDEDAALRAVRAVEGTHQADRRGTEITVRTGNGAALASRLALAAAEAGATVRALTLRTPSLDDVFLQVTGDRLESVA